MQGVNDFVRDFVHLHVHSDASLLDGLCKISETIERVKEMGQKAIAITNHGNMYDCIEFYEQCLKNDIKPIIGMEAYLTGDRFDYQKALKDIEQNKSEKKKLKGKELKEFNKPTTTKEWFAEKINSDPRYLAFHSKHDVIKNDETFTEIRYRPAHLILLCKNEVGYRNLIQIASESQIHGFYGVPRIDYEFLEKHSEGLICTSACLSGPISILILNGYLQEAKNLALYFSQIFEDFYLEIQPNTLEDQLYVNSIIIKMAEELNIPLIVTSDAHYIRKEDFDKHCVLLAVQTKGIVGEEGTFCFSENSFYLHSAQELEELGMPLEAIDNTVELANKCNLTLELNKPLLPHIHVPPGYTTQEWLEVLSYQKLMHYLNTRPTLNRNEYIDRILFELDIIKKKEIADYILIVSRFISEMKKRNIYIGPGRGSACGSLVCFLTSITAIDPIKYDLLFERFLSLDRKELPDVDSDVMQFLTLKGCEELTKHFDIFIDGRKEVIAYFEEVYGKDNVCQVGAFGTEETKVIVRDVARALDIPYKEVIELNKNIPSDAGKLWSLQDCLYGNSKEGYSPIQEVIDFYNKDEKHRKTIDTAIALRGVKRNVSIHAGGVCITPQPVQTLAPLRLGKNGELVTQFDKVDVEKAGLVKLDVLGLKLLGILYQCIQNIKRNQGIEIIYEDIPLEDPGALAMIKKGDTAGVFQVESDGMTQVFQKLNKVTFEDIVAVLSLYGDVKVGYMLERP